MDFTREPIIETVITPKEGCKIVVRSSKSNGQEEHFVDAVEVVSFGHSFFFRSLERPKTFLVPATDYEILEVREARMVLKNVGIDRTIKIAGGREAQVKVPREPYHEKVENRSVDQPQEASNVSVESSTAEKPQDARLDKKRDRRRNSRRRRGRDGVVGDDAQGSDVSGEKGDVSESLSAGESGSSPLNQQVATTSVLTSLLPPPAMLISETIAHYKDKFKEAFYSKDEPKPEAPADDHAATHAVPLSQPEYGSFELSEEEEEKIYQQRKKQIQKPEELDDAHPHHQEEGPGMDF